MMPDYILPPAMQQLAESIQGKTLHRQIQLVQMAFLRYGYRICADNRVILTPLELDASGAGDCKAHAVAKYLVLLRAGVPMADMRLVITRTALRVPHMILLVGDRVLDLQAFVYATSDVPYIPYSGFNHETHGFCENSAEAWFGFGRRQDVVWDFTYSTFDHWLWRFWHLNYFRYWRKFNKKLELEANMNLSKTFAQTLQPSPFEQAMIDLGVEADLRGMSPESVQEITALVIKAEGHITPALFVQMTAKARQEYQVFLQRNQSGLRAISQKMGVKL